MLEPREIIENIITFFNPKLSLKGRRVLITAGPTHEAIDPVRFIGNYSSGKMGFALAKVAAGLGAEVILISGPSEEKINHPSISLLNVTSADMMFEEIKKYYKSVDIAIASAAVSDFKPKNYINQKIKKTQKPQFLELTPTKDILAYMGKNKKNQCLIGFALETENELENAKHKLKKKNLDGIVLNSMQDDGAGFSGATNKIKFIRNNNTVEAFPLQSKLECAHRIFEQILFYEHL
jgi:phosphopantothenoylcysteine decarboxylase/phosphopantothenate--cysteine ligase